LTILKSSPQKSRLNLWQKHFDTNVVLDSAEGFLKKLKKAGKKIIIEMR